MQRFELRRDRLGRVLERMERMGQDQLLLASPDSIDYLTGCRIKPLRRLLVLYLRRGEVPVLIYSSVNGDISIGGAESLRYGPTQRPLSALARRVSRGRLGIDPEWSARFLLPFLEARPDVVPVLGADAVLLTRAVKDAEEQERMRAASRMNDAVFEKAFRAFSGERSEIQMSNRMGRLFEEALGRHMGVAMVSYGPNAANPHHAPTEKRPAPGECVLIDSGKALDGYMSDMTRTGFFQRVSRRDQMLHHIVREANLAGIAAVRPGIPGREVDRAARAVIERAGYGPFFVHRTGHGIGMEGQETPSIDGGCALILEPGMCFTVEPGIYLPGRLGIRIEDVVMVTETGAETLNHYTKALQIVG